MFESSFLEVIEEPGKITSLLQTKEPIFGLVEVRAKGIRRRPYSTERRERLSNVQNTVDRSAELSTVGRDSRD